MRRATPVGGELIYIFYKAIALYINMDVLLNAIDSGVIRSLVVRMQR